MCNMGIVVRAKILSGDERVCHSGWTTVRTSTNRSWNEDPLSLLFFQFNHWVNTSFLPFFTSYFQQVVLISSLLQQFNFLVICFSCHTFWVNPITVCWMQAVSVTVLCGLEDIFKITGRLIKPRGNSCEKRKPNCFHSLKCPLLAWEAFC